MYGGQYDKLLYVHLDNYNVYMNYKFANLVWQSIPLFYAPLVKIVILPFVFLFKVVAFYILMFYLFNLNNYFYRLYFLVSLIMTFFHPKVMQLHFFIKFLNLISHRDNEKERMQTYNQNLRNKNKNKFKTDRERFIEIIQKELKYPDALFPIFLYYIVYKRTILHDMLIDVCVFCLNAFFKHSKDKNKRKNNAFVLIITREADLLSLFFIFNILLAVGIFSIPLLVIKTLVGIFCTVFKLMNLDKFIFMQLRFLKSRIVYHNRMIQSHLIDAAASGADDPKNINAKKIAHTIYTYMNPFRRLNETVKLYILGFIHMEQFYRGVFLEVQKTEKTKAHYEEFLEPVEDLELMKTFIFYVPYKAYVFPYNFVTKLGKFFFIKTPATFSN